MVRILFVLAFIGVVLPKVLLAQNPPFQNPSLDSNCFFPQIGKDIDTIVGNGKVQRLGEFIYNLGAKSDGSLGCILIGNSEENPMVFDKAATGAQFDLHNLQATAESLYTETPMPGQWRFCHLRDRRTVDIFDTHSWTIYWADDNGDYAENHSTRLQTNVRGSNGIIREGGVLFIPYVTRLSSDSLDDIVVGVITDNYPNDARDSLFLLLYRGGGALANRDTAFEDTSISFGPDNGHSWNGLQGDFRGTGRIDLVASDGYAVFYFRNDPPFSLQKLIDAVKYDTIWVKNGRLPLFMEPQYAIVMPLFPKKSGDRSVDFAVTFGLNYDSIFMFRGGPNFGSHRITIDSAAYVLLPPKSLESDWPGDFVDAGDMTGTGNHVFYTMGSNGNVAGYQNFYVTGQALDSKIDIFSVVNTGAYGDTLTANSDSLEDFLLGLPYYGNGVPGSLWLMHGSKQIPVHLNPQFAGVETTQHLDILPLTCSPNPATQSTVLHIKWPESEAVTLVVRDMLGHAVETEQLRLEAGESELRLAVGGLPAGVYFVTVEGASRRASTGRFVKIADAVPDERGSFMQSLRARVHGDVPALPEGTLLPR